VYDFCYCLEEYPGGVQAAGADWESRLADPLVSEAIRILAEKFQSTRHFGPQQLPAFHAPADRDQAAQYARRAYELVQRFLREATRRETS
jgi:hypothetical protein